MILGNLKGRRVLIDNAADASTLRNKGSVGRNLGERLSLDLATSLDLLLRKKIQVRKRTSPVTIDQMEAMMSDEERKTAIAYHFLKAKGMRPVIRNRKLYVSEKRVIVFQDDETIDFDAIKSRSWSLAITDQERSCLFYLVNRLNIRENVPKIGKKETTGHEVRGPMAILQARGMTVASGFKFGSEFRIYDGNSSHARYLMTTGERTLARDLVARVRIAQSVRKSFVQAVFDNERKRFNFLEIKWIRL